MVGKADIVIIGAGIIGVSTAYNLVEKGIRNIVIIEKNYPGSGGSFRCATGIRASFTSEEHVLLMKESVKLWKELSEKHGFFYLRGGYVWLLSTEEQLELFKKFVEFHNSLGVPTRIISVEEIEKLVPTINTSGLVGGVYDPLAGKADCFKSLLLLLKYVRDKGVQVYTGTLARKIVVENSRVQGVETDKGFIEAKKIVVAAGYGSRDLLKTAGVDAPLNNLPKHALVTEKFNERFKPLLVDWSSTSYMVQTSSGTFLIGAEIEEEYNVKPVNRIEFLYKAAQVWVKYFPWLAEINVLRYWTGYYVMTPDHHPILGPIDDIDGLYVATGFSGHGFMMAPIVGKLMAEWIIEEKPSIPIAENLKLKRFREGKMIKEIAVFG
ncbi:FAD-binding oxidoreductase [Desulfurococcaceae archaeon MEX13E-LK6-19]|nr:FAD-binding oxidoreductase [Desulfurococcaceae archaeon MEX13E-LK6-19]